MFSLGQIDQIRNQGTQNQKHRENRQHGPYDEMVFHKPHSPGDRPADSEREQNPQDEGERDGNACVKQSLKYQHLGELFSGHADGFHHSEFFFSGYDACQNGVDKIQDSHHADNSCEHTAD